MTMVQFRLGLAGLMTLAIAAYPLQWTWFYLPDPARSGTHLFSWIAVTLIAVALTQRANRTASTVRNGLLSLAAFIAIVRLVELGSNASWLDAIQSTLIGRSAPAPSMGELTSLTVLFLSTSMMMVNDRFSRMGQLLFLFAVTCVTIALVGYNVGSEQVAGGMALMTAFGFSAVCFAAHREFREYEPMRFLFLGETYSRRMGLRFLGYNGVLLSVTYALTHIDPAQSAFVPYLVIVAVAVLNYLFFQGTFSYVRAVEAENARRKALVKAVSDAEHANAVKSQFLAMISHELRTPLTGILGMADLLHMSDLNAEQSMQLKTLSKSANTLLDLLNEVLDFSKFEAGKLELNDAPFSIRHVLSHVQMLFSPIASAKDLTLVVDMPETTDDIVVGDGLRLRQVIANLVNNAIKFTWQGEIIVAASLPSQRTGYLDFSLSVKDTGIGIPEDKLEKIFDPFAQADGSTTRQYGGTGLGLSIAKAIVESMGGSLTVQSEEGKGSIFSIQVSFSLATPAQVETFLADLETEEKAAENEVAELVNSSTRHLSILVADDTSTIRDLLKAMLSAAGHTVTLVEDGRAAVTAFETGRFDIILMDMHMPVLNGMEAAQKIKAMQSSQPETAPVPIIAITADIMKENRDRMFDSGIDGLVSKPISWAALGQEIERLTPSAANPEDAGQIDPEIAALPSFSPEKIDELIEAVGEDTTDILMAQFVNGYTDQIQVLKNTVITGDMEAVREAGHKLKGMCLQFGAPRAAAIGAFIQNDAETLDDVALYFSILDSDGDDARQAISLWRSNSLATDAQHGQSASR